MLRNGTLTLDYVPLRDIKCKVNPKHINNLLGFAGYNESSKKGIQTMHIYLIKYISGATLSECVDSETANNQVVAVRNFKSRKPDAKHIKIKNRHGVWLYHS